MFLGTRYFWPTATSAKQKPKIPWPGWIRVFPRPGINFSTPKALGQGSLSNWKKSTKYQYHKRWKDMESHKKTPKTYKTIFLKKKTHHSIDDQLPFFALPWSPPCRSSKANGQRPGRSQARIPAATLKASAKRGPQLTGDSADAVYAALEEQKMVTWLFLDLSKADKQLLRLRLKELRQVNVLQTCRHATRLVDDLDVTFHYNCHWNNKNRELFAFSKLITCSTGWWAFQQLLNAFAFLIDSKNENFLATSHLFSQRHWSLLSCFFRFSRFQHASKSVLFLAVLWSFGTIDLFLVSTKGSWEWEGIPVFDTNVSKVLKSTRNKVVSFWVKTTVAKLGRAATGHGMRCTGHRNFAATLQCRLSKP